jgi:transcriptional regulator with XRE-family HTH domain
VVNINKIKELCQSRGIKQTYLCEQLGLQKVYLNDVAKRGGKMPDDRIRKIADTLGTSYEYLTDQTDDPTPPMIIFSSEEKTIVNHMVEVLREVNEEQRQILTNVLLLPSDKLTHIMQGINLIRNA